MTLYFNLAEDSQRTEPRSVSQITFIAARYALALAAISYTAPPARQRSMAQGQPAGRTRRQSSGPGPPQQTQVTNPRQARNNNYSSGPPAEAEAGGSGNGPVTLVALSP
jgi:hypothetical protein